MAEGIDIYGKYQTVTNWAAVAQAKQFVWIKLSDGLSIRGDYGYVSAAKSVGLPVGGYHYAEFGDPIAQANFFIDRCLFYGATQLCPALDMESPFSANQVAIDFSIAFVKQVRLRGFRPALYANNSMLNTIGNPVKQAVPEVLIWLARYGATPTFPYDVWQYSSAGSVPGIAGSVDLNKGIIPWNIPPAPPLPPPSPPAIKQQKFFLVNG